jgi:hypothetical protein
MVQHSGSGSLPSPVPLDNRAGWRRRRVSVRQGCGLIRLQLNHECWAAQIRDRPRLRVCGYRSGARSSHWMMASTCRPHLCARRDASAGTFRPREPHRPVVPARYRPGRRYDVSLSLGDSQQIRHGREWHPRVAVFPSSVGGVTLERARVAQSGDRRPGAAAARSCHSLPFSGSVHAVIASDGCCIEPTHEVLSLPKVGHLVGQKDSDLPCRMPERS